VTASHYKTGWGYRCGSFTAVQGWRPGLCGSRPLVSHLIVLVYTRNLLCCLYVCALIVSQIAYTVLVETLNPAHSLFSAQFRAALTVWCCGCVFIVEYELIADTFSINVVTKDQIMPKTVRTLTEMHPIVTVVVFLHVFACW